MNRSSRPHTSLPPTSAEFVRHVMARLPRSERPGSTGKTGGAQAPQPQPAPASSPTSAPAPQTPASPSHPACHPERSEGSHLNHPASTTDKTHPIPATRIPQPAAPSASRQEPRPAAGPQTGPSGLPVLAPLPPRKLEVPPGSRSS
jgi:hypothetical protein